MMIPEPITKQIPTIYFGISNVQSKRIFINDIPGLFLDPSDYECVPHLLILAGVFYNSTESQWPMYLAPVPVGKPDGIYWNNKDCFDCRLKGGVTELPDFWK